MNDPVEHARQLTRYNNEPLHIQDVRQELEARSAAHNERDSSESPGPDAD